MNVRWSVSGCCGVNGDRGLDLSDGDDRDLENVSVSGRNLSDGCDCGGDRDLDCALVPRDRAWWIWNLWVCRMRLVWWWWWME